MIRFPKRKDMQCLWGVNRAKPKWHQYHCTLCHHCTRVRSWGDAWQYFISFFSSYCWRTRWDSSAWIEDTCRCWNIHVDKLNIAYLLSHAEIAWFPFKLAKTLRLSPFSRGNCLIPLQTDGDLQIISLLTRKLPGSLIKSSSLLKNMNDWLSPNGRREERNFGRITTICFSGFPTALGQCRQRLHVLASMISPP